MLTTDPRERLCYTCDRVDHTGDDAMCNGCRRTRAALAVHEIQCAFSGFFDVARDMHAAGDVIGARAAADDLALLLAQIQTRYDTPSFDLQVAA